MSEKTRYGGKEGALEKYNREVNAIPILTPESEREIAKRWRETGDMAARETLITHNLRLARKIAGEYWGQPSEDLIQQGNIGLITAANRFDPNRGVRFGTYAAWWIRASILDYIIKNWRLVKVGGNRKIQELQKVKKYFDQHDEEITPEKLVEMFEVNPKEAGALLGMLNPEQSLDAPDSEGRDLYGKTAATGAEPEELVMDAQMRARYAKALKEVGAALDEREKRILEERLLTDEPKTLAEMGLVFGLSRERVRQLEERIKKKLRAYLEADAIE